LRKYRELNINQLAEIIDLDAGFLGQIERGVGVPSLKTLATIAASLNVPLPELFQEASQGPSENFMVRETAALLKRQGPKERKMVLNFLREFSKLRSKN
jgi:transcriptional regulator with XRE-family HTH domain